MDTHVRALGTFNILFGVGSVLLTILVIVMYGSPLGLYNSMVDNVFALIISGSVTFHMILALPCLIGGIYLRKFADWSRSMMIVASALNILNPPIGCVLGCYGLWVLLTDETDPLFTDPPPPFRAKKATTSVAIKQSHPQDGEEGASPTGGIVPSPRS